MSVQQDFNAARNLAGRAAENTADSYDRVTREYLQHLMQEISSVIDRKGRFIVKMETGMDSFTYGGATTVAKVVVKDPGGVLLGEVGISGRNEDYHIGVGYRSGDQSVFNEAAHLSKDNKRLNDTEAYQLFSYVNEMIKAVSGSNAEQPAHRVRRREPA